MQPGRAGCPNPLDKFQLWKLVEETRACAGILFSFFLSFLLLNNHRQGFPVLRIILVVVSMPLSLLIRTNFVIITFINDNKFWIGVF